ncbi:MAG: hypothetical protein PHU08_02390 [Dehalococcoidales bacterium]|nr:hypothetical protein [Dehalococcoidales bacterium]
MSKYRDHQDFGINAPINWRENTTIEAFIKGMSGIAPPGMKPKESRGRRFEEHTDKDKSARWHRNYDIAMFGGTDIPLPASQMKQADLEDLLNHGLARKPQVVETEDGRKF